MEAKQLSDSMKLAYYIIRLDRERDEVWEELLKAEGNRALELLRYVQNYK